MSRRMIKSMSTLAITGTAEMLIAVAINKLNTRRLRLARKLSGSTQPRPNPVTKGTTIPLGKSAERSSLADDQVDVCLKPGNDQQNSTPTRRLPRGGRTEPGFSEICGLVGKGKSSRTARDQAQRPQAIHPRRVAG